MAGIIPMRPKGVIFDLLPEEMDGLSYYVLSGCSRESAFLKFVRPDFIGSKAPTAVKAAVSQFFASKNAKDYMEAYKKTIEDLTNPTQVKEVPAGNMEQRKAKAKTKLVEFAMTLANNIEEADDPEAVLKIADKIGLLDQDEEVIEKPRRYLPVSCETCSYRAFCEQDCEDLCERCRAKDFAVDHGFEYKKQTLMESSGTLVAEEP